MTQPPYGEPEQPQQYPGYQPPPPPPPSGPASPYQSFPQGYPQQPYAYAPAPRSNTTRNVLIAVAVVVVLLCGGAIAGTAALVGNATSDFEDRYNDDYRGSENRPITVEPGAEFSIRGFTYAAGWALAGGAEADSAITGLTATNDRDDEESDRATVVFTLLSGDTILQQINCYADADISYGRSTALDCDGLYEKLPTYETLEVHATALYE